MSKFGPFSSAFESHPGYLAFLWMSPDCQSAIDRVEDSIRETRGIDNGDCEVAVWIGRLFEETNWRPHLVGAIALLLGAARDTETRALWRAIDRGSWVVPQLVVTAYLRDPAFSTLARERIAARCPLLEGAWGDPPPRHFSAKTLSSLLELTSGIPSLTSWVEAVRQEPDVIGLLGADRDHGGSIAAEWMAALKEEFEKRGRPLIPAWAQATG